MLLVRLYRQNGCSGLADFAILVKNAEFSDLGIYAVLSILSIVYTSLYATDCRQISVSRTFVPTSQPETLLTTMARRFC